MHLRSMSIFSSFLFFANMLVAKQVGKHASIMFFFFFFFLVFLHICFFIFILFFIIYAMMMFENTFVHMFK